MTEAPQLASPSAPIPAAETKELRLVNDLLHAVNELNEVVADLTVYVASRHPVQCPNISV